MTASKKIATFQIVRSAGLPDRFQLPGGEWLERNKDYRIFVKEYGGFVPCLDYSPEGHFIYEMPEYLAKKYPGPIYRCSCGSSACIVGPSGYVFGQTAEGKMWVCMAHLDTGQHLSGGSRWI